MPIRVRLVTAAGPTIGRGHLARALSLAETDWGAEADIDLELIEGELTEGERSRLERAGARSIGGDVAIVPATAVVLDVPDPDSVAGRFDPTRLAVFDDRDSFGGSAELVIQPSLASWTGRATAGRVLAGFAFVPISAAIRERRMQVPAPPPDQARRPYVVVCFGGSDPHSITERLAPATVRDLAGRADVDVVIGASYAGSTHGWPIEPVRDPPDFVERIATADLLVFGAGTMKFEAACLGRPMVLVAAADDQGPVGPAFAATGAARYLGDGRTIDPEVVAAAVSDLLDDAGSRQELADTARRVIDGDGAARIADAVAAVAQAAGAS
jgi:spore coat polysaccharide biosynthesis predicted glycosyltransferase SpsG